MGERSGITSKGSGDERGEEEGVCRGGAVGSVVGSGSESRADRRDRGRRGSIRIGFVNHRNNRAFK